MKVIIAGSRTVENYDLVKLTIEQSGFTNEITEVVSGCAKGVDLYGERWAKEHCIPVKRFPADWSEHGKKAGPIRNEEMAQYADALIAVWDGASRGTEDMIERALENNLSIYVHNYGNQDLL